MKTEDNHNWIDEKDCFNSGFNKGYELAIKECKKMFDDYNKKLKLGLWSLETINRHQEGFKGLLPIRAVEKEIDKLSKEVLGE